MMQHRFLKKKPMKDQMDLQITSMADIFTILLVFLLKSFSTGMVTITPSAGVHLPQAKAGDPPVESIKLEVSENAVQLEGKAITKLNQFQFERRDIQSNGTSRTIEDALSRERKRQLIIAKSNTDVKLDPKIMILADQRAPYSAIKTVLASAAVQGYTDFKLVIVRED